MTNPSEGSHRAAVLAIALVGMGFALYLGLFQLHVLHSVWDPIFGAGSVRVLKSRLSRRLPVPDSMLGAFGYFCEAVAVAIGGRHRFDSLPWSVLLYVFIALGMGTVSLALVAYQTFVIESWCTLCLFSALLSVLLLIPAFQEGVPAVHAVRTRRKNGESWRMSLRLFMKPGKRNRSDAQTAA